MEAKTEFTSFEAAIAHAEEQITEVLKAVVWGDDASVLEAHANEALAALSDLRTFYDHDFHLYECPHLPDGISQEVQP